MGVRQAKGNGHQAIAVQMIKRIRDIGYKGRLELFYEAGIEKKLELLMPPFRADIATPQYIPQLDLEAQRWIRPPKVSVKLAIVPADGIDDEPFGPWELNAEKVLTIHPPRWGSAPELRLNQNQFLFGRSAIDLDTVPHYAPVPIAAPNPQDIPQFLNDQLGHTDRLRAKIPGLATIFKHKKDLQLLSAYGLGFNGVQPLITLVDAMDRLQRLSPKIASRPIVIGLLSNLNEDEWREFYFELPERLKEKLSVVRIDGDNLKEAILDRDQITIVRIGNVTQDVWNFLMDQSDLPPLAAGTTAVNFLSQRGKPFLVTTPLGTNEFSPPADALGYECGADVKRFLSMPQFLSERVSNVVARFYYNSLNPSSRINCKFKKYADGLKQLGDRTCISLLTMREYLGQ